MSLGLCLQGWPLVCTMFSFLILSSCWKNIAYLGYFQLKSSRNFCCDQEGWWLFSKQLMDEPIGFENLFKTKVNR